MTEFSIKCQSSKADKNALTANVFLRSPFLILCFVFFILILAVLPVMQFISLVFRGIINPVLLLYIISLVMMIIVTVKQDNYVYNGVTEYLFSSEGFTAKNSQSEFNHQYSAVYCLAETKKHFFIKLNKYSAYILPKEFLTIEDGELLRELFASRLIGRKNDEHFGGKAAGDDFTHPCESMGEISFILPEKYPREAAAVSFVTIPTAVKMFYMFMLITLLLSGLSLVLAVIFAAVTLAISFVSSLKKIAGDLAGRIKDDKVIYRFYETGFECVMNGNSTIVSYADMTGIKKKNITAQITRSDGRKIILPITDDIFEEIKKFERK